MNLECQTVKYPLTEVLRVMDNHILRRMHGARPFLISSSGHVNIIAADVRTPADCEAIEHEIWAAAVGRLGRTPAARLEFYRVARG